MQIRIWNTSRRICRQVIRILNFRTETASRLRTVNWISELSSSPTSSTNSERTTKLRCRHRSWKRIIRPSRRVLYPFWIIITAQMPKARVQPPRGSNRSYRRCSSIFAYFSGRPKNTIRSRRILRAIIPSTGRELSAPNTHLAMIKGCLAQGVLWMRGLRWAKWWKMMMVSKTKKQRELTICGRLTLQGTRWARYKDEMQASHLVINNPAMTELVVAAEVEAAREVQDQTLADRTTNWSK